MPRRAPQAMAARMADGIERTRAQGEATTARQFAEHALSIDASDAVAHCALARIDVGAGDPAAAAARLQPLLATPDLSADNRSTAASLLGDALARLDKPAAAVAAYGAFAAPIVIGEQIKLGTPQMAMYGFAVFYALCLLLNWWFYLRAGAEIKNP